MDGRRPRAVNPLQRVAERSAERAGALTDRAVRADIDRLARYRADDPAPSPWLDLPEQAAPGSPPAGWVRVYPKSDGRLYYRDDAGTEYALPGDFLPAAGGTVTGVLTVDADLVIAVAGTQAMRLYDAGIIEFATGSPNIRAGAGDPEGVVSAVPGSLFLSSNGNAYRKGSGTGNTGWIAT